MKLLEQKKKIIMGLLLTVLLLIVATVITLMCGINKNYDLELGEELDLQQLNRLPFGQVIAYEELAWSELELGEYNLKVKMFNVTHEICINIVDTTPPTAEGCSITSNPLVELLPEDCVVDSYDLTEIIYSFKDEINYEIEDEQEIIIILKDESGNQSKITSFITIIQDVTPPTIEGEDSYRILLGESIAYRELVSVTDDREGDIDLQIDNSLVDTSKEGTYKVLYTATDLAGHVSEKEIEIIIYKYVAASTGSSSSSSSNSSSSNTSSSSSSSSQTTEELAEAVLSSIITSGMSQTQKAKAIYTWCYTKISYSSGSPSGWENAARQGLTTKKGGCFTYASTARFLLTQAGITNMSIQSSDHYWNLIDVGSGWYHFDSTYCSDKVQLFMYTDEQLTAYYNTGYKARHNYDKSSYPSIN